MFAPSSWSAVAADKASALNDLALVLALAGEVALDGGRDAESSWSRD